MEEKLYNHFGCGPDALCSSFCILLRESLFAHLTTLACDHRCDNSGAFLGQGILLQESLFARLTALACDHRCDNPGAFLGQGEHKLSCLGLVGHPSVFSGAWLRLKRIWQQASSKQYHKFDIKFCDV